MSSDTNDFEERDAWAVYTNEDLTEGRGRNFPLHICEIEATAVRLSRKAGVQGCDADVYQVKLLRKKGGAWYGPIVLKGSKREDDEAQRAIDARRAIEAKAIAAGMSQDDLRILRGK